MFRAYDISKIKQFLVAEYQRHGYGAVELFDGNTQYGTIALNEAKVGNPIRITDRMFLHYDYDKGDNARTNGTAKMIAGLALRLNIDKMKWTINRSWSAWS